jgi:hypothetical protein
MGWMDYSRREKAIAHNELFLATGTPAGIGSARTPPVYLKPGDRIECAADGLGRQNNPVVQSQT